MKEEPEPGICPPSAVSMTQQELELENKRLRVDRELLELEKLKNDRDQLFLNRYFGTVITTVVSIAAVLVSLAQVWVAQIQKDKEMQAANMEADRQWKIEAAKFVADHQSSIFSSDDRQRELMRKVIGVAFPREISEGLVVKIQIAQSSNLLRQFWKPNGTDVDTSHEAAIRHWLKSNSLNVSLTMFLDGESFEEARFKAVKDLQLDIRQTTITDVPDESLLNVEESLKEEGATAIGQRRQPDGHWTVTATLP